MSRLIFEARRRLAPPSARKGTITIEAPPELPRVIPPSLFRRAMPYLIGILIVGMIVALFATGMRVISPQTLFFPFVLLLAATALYRGNDNKMRTEEVDAERADYLRYLSVVRDNIRAQAAEQRTAAEWSHPEPEALAAVPGSRRQWERDPHDPDFLVLRAGRHSAPLTTALRVNDTADEIDLEPVSHSALRSLLDTQRTVRDVPTGVDLTKLSRITVIPGAGAGQAEVRGAVRAWIAQAVTWHDPTVLGVALASRDLEGRDWSWLKWLPHVDIPGQVDGVGPARYLTTDPDDLIDLLGPAIEDRPAFTGRPVDALRHLLIVVDDPGYDLNLSTLAAGRAGVTVLHISATPPNREQYSDPEKPILQVAGGAIQRWQTGGWQPYIDAADQFGADEAAHLARRLSRWDSNPTHTGLRSAATRGANFTTLLGISDASRLDVPALWAPRSRDEELRVPIGVTATGEPLMFDLKDEAEGGMGPHGLMIGMTGSGKSQTLMSILLALLTTHSADRLIVIYADFKGEAGADSFRNFPQVVAVISNMAEKKSLADRFADTLRGEVARREMLLREAGRRVQGSAFNSVTEYEAAQAAGHDLPPIPTLFVVADEFTLMLADHPEYAELFDYVARKGRSFRIHILFASQTLDVGKIKDIDKNTSYRIGLKVASPSVSRQIIGVEDAYHIESGKEHKGIGFLVPAPGATPIKFRSTYVDGIYEPPQTAKTLVVQSIPEPKLFTAAAVEPDPGMVIAGGEEDEPIGPPRKLIATIGEQLAGYGPRAPQLWLPPLDEPIPLTAVLARSGIQPRQWRWPLGEVDKPFEMRRDPLVFDATSAAGNMVIHGGPKSGKSTALQTFIMSAASLHSPREVTFYCLDYGGGQLRALEDLAHVGTVASALEPERIRRTFGELEQLLLYRQHREAFRDRPGNGQGVAPQDDGFGEVFLVIDNLYAFSRDNTDQFNTRNPLLAKVTELVNVGLAYGIHVVVTTPSWLEVPLAMRDGLGLRLELRLHDARDSNVRVAGALHRPAEAVPHDQPGRGLTMAAQHFLFAEPQLEQIAEINARYPGQVAPPVRLLPTNLTPAAVGALYRGPEQIVIGQREQDLAPVVHDFREHPLLMVFGDSKSGKTTLLRHIIRTIRENSTADQVAFTVLDRRLHLVDEPLFPDNEYTANIDRITPAMIGLANLIESRRPPAGLSPAELSRWTYQGGPDSHTHYLIIDDVDQVPDSAATSGPYVGQRPWTPLIGLLGQAAELGLRVIVTGRASGSAHALMTNPLLRRFNDLQATTLMLAGNPQDSGKIRGQRFSRLPAGRAVLLSDSDDPTYLQLVNPLVGAASIIGDTQQEGSQS
ncbi:MULTISPECIES: type VII secretion protein EccCa [Mycobacterium]|uniref:type VII secretion protein EccCa n=1 Tax=Mycobacterium TaxID=1763 RepID=UPI001EE2B197|nr:MULTISPECIES: type VII secretion protein EccCa [Mycobacterium]BDE11950.1 type VII secretion protein EccC [Mycobacterium sp. 20KCMC460]GLB91804.1 type VII secretion protein EccC [Mycobacterium kiyosense]GLC04238.1 type VII secretion protein EccC [Mycobacterium kiyosense]GLC10553.1 type VII secretion protein EccC [Mycobacterium kiyosense]GLC16630.1 type VII secretion protein EccC [Mycobacterium kiyosense]